MKLTHRSGLIAFIAAAFVVAVMTGCTKYASPDDLQRLEAARQAVLSAEKERDGVKDDIRKQENMIKAKDDSLQAVRNEFTTVKSR